MNFVCLASSSAGNCYYVELERKGMQPVKLLIEAGIKFREIAKKLVLQGHNIADVEAVLVTHGHEDHVAGRKELVKKGFKVYGNDEMASSQETILKHAESRYIAANTLVTPFSVEHDVHDPLGFVIQTDTETILFATDLKYFKADLSGIKFDYVFIESNYDGRVMHFAIKNAKESGNRSVAKGYERVIHSHMSITNTVETLKKLDLTRCKAIFLMHLSDRHANELLFKKQVYEATKTNCFACKKNGGIV